MRKRRAREVDLNEKLRTCEKWSTSLTWPAPLDERLNALVDLAIEAGEASSLSRAEVIASLVFTAPADGEALREVLGRYRKALVRDVVLPAAAPDSDVILLHDRKPGRR